MRGAIQFSRLPRAHAVPRKRRPTPGIRLWKLGAKLMSLLAASLGAGLANRDDVIDWCYEVRREVDVDHAREVA